LVCLLGGVAVAPHAAWARQSAEELTPSVIYKMAVNSVVRITIKDTNGYQFTGGGFFVNDELHVVTSYHVVSGAVSIKVEGTSGAAWDVVQVKINRNSDLALLRLDKPSGRRPLPYSGLGGAHPNDSIVAVGNLLAPVVNNMSTGLVHAVRRVDDQTVLDFTTPDGTVPLGSPVLDSHGRVIAIERIPFQDSPAENVGATVLGIGFLGGPIPWTAFASGVREAVADSKLEAASPGNRTDKVEMSQEFAKWLNGVLSADLRWQNAYLQLLTQNPPRDPNQLDAPYKAFLDALDNGVQGVKGLAAKIDGLGDSEFDSRIAGLLKAAKELREAQQVNVLDGQQVDLERAARAANRYDNAQEGFLRTQGSLNSLLADEPWFAWSSVAFEFSPPVWGSMYTQGLFDAMPNADRADVPVIGGVSVGSDFQEGDVVDGLAPDVRSPFVPVASWQQVADFISRHPALKRLYVRVQRRGAHAMFYSRPAGDD
jgi:hypothetical protein